MCRRRYFSHGGKSSQFGEGYVGRNDLPRRSVSHTQAGIPTGLGGETPERLCLRVFSIYNPQSEILHVLSHPFEETLHPLLFTLHRFSRHCPTLSISDPFGVCEPRQMHSANFTGELRAVSFSICRAVEPLLFTLHRCTHAVAAASKRPYGRSRVSFQPWPQAVSQGKKCLMRRCRHGT